MGQSACMESKGRAGDYQTPRGARPAAAGFRAGPNGPVPDTLDDVRRYFGMPRDDFLKMLVHSMSQTEEAVYDVAIVGGGPGGCYTAYRTHKEFPGKKVVLFEKTDRIGGRLYSVNHHNKVREELGGMRIFPSIMQNLVELIDDCGLDLVPVGLGDAHNIFYYKGKRYEKGQFKINGRSPGQMADACVAKYKEAFTQAGAGDPYMSEELRSLSLQSFFLKYGATQEEIDAWSSYSGYDLYPSNIAASIFVKDGELYGAKLSSEQKYVKQGFQTLVKRLLDKSTANVRMNTKVLSVAKQDDSDSYVVTASDNFGRISTVKAKHVVISLPHDHMRELMETLDVSPERKEAMNCVQMFPLFKAFLAWEPDKVWWREKGFGQGKSTTDLPLRQVHYYDENDLLIYNSGASSYYWKAEFEHDVKGAARKMFEMVKELHNMPDMPEPIIHTEILHKFWPDGSHKWKTDVDIYETMNLICHGNQDQSKVFLCGDAFSGYQGWVLGALQTADICWEEMRKTL